MDSHAGRSVSKNTVNEMEMAAGFVGIVVATLTGLSLEKPQGLEMVLNGMNYFMSYAVCHLALIFSVVLASHGFFSYHSESSEEASE